MDRRVVLAVVLMMGIAMLPAIFFQRPPVPAVVDSTAAAPPPAPSASAPVPAPILTAADSSAPVQVPEAVHRVGSPLYTYGVSTRGARLVEAVLNRYQTLRPGESGFAQILRDNSDLLGFRLVTGGDTLQIREWDFTPASGATGSTSQTTATPLVLTATRQGVTVTLTYRFTPDNYLLTVDGQIQGLGPNGGTLLVGMGPGLRDTERDSVEHQRELALITKASETEKQPFSGLDRDVTTTLGGPFEWVAVKSKYFVAALFAVDTTASGFAGRLGGVAVRPTEAGRRPTAADVVASLPVSAAGQVRFTLYAGPMEYPRLRGMGHDFYDVNPYGWPGFRTIIRPVAVAGRWLLVRMYDFGIAYGWGLVLFGIFVRLALWPLNQKAMRASMQMQAVQPLMKELQDRYKNDPQKLQQEMFKLYKEYNVNPFGGCWPMLVPMPILLALFFVFQNTIELRGAPFLWLTDLSRPDPLYIIPVLMGLSMYVVTKIGQRGMPPNPQMKMMLYIMPGMMTVLFLNFASGLNLYYAVQNLASIPQQWLLAKERMKNQPPPRPVPVPSAGRKR